MKNHQEPKESFRKVAWTINNFSTLQTNQEFCSDVFTIRGFAWRIALYRGRQDGKYLAIYLKVADSKILPNGWSVHAVCRFSVVNHDSTKKFEREDLNQKLCANNDNWGYTYFMELDKLHTDGYIWNDRCVVEVEFLQVSSEGTQVAPKEDEEAVEFKDLGQIQKILVPLLEEACLCYPSLMDCKKNRSRKFTEWAFTTLGRVLQFLKNKKWKDMNEKACEELKQLWDELRMSGLDLNWLEPHVESAINMKGYVEKAMEGKRLKKGLVILKTEMNKMKENLAIQERTVEMIIKEMNKITENLAIAERTVEMTIKDLVQVEYDFKEKNLDLDDEIPWYHCPKINIVSSKT